MIESTDSFSILIVDDEPINIQVAAGYLKNENLKISFATSGTEALKRITAVDFDLFILDIMMPEMDGFELCRIIKQNPRYKDVPIIFLTAKVDKESLIEGFNQGAADYLTKPFFAQELVHRVSAHLKIRYLQRRMEEYTNELNLQILRAMKMEQELKENEVSLYRANQTLLEMASRDPLTQLFNRRRALELMDYEADRCLRHKRPIGVILMDLDHFKSINDVYGHDKGDEVLVNSARTISNALRKQDMLSRWGGEEFLVILPETNEAGTLIVAEKIRKALESTDQILIDRSITISLGCSMKLPETGWDEAIKAADEALYEAKNGGRNTVKGLGA